jgi:hypothetical protein
MHISIDTKGQFHFQNVALLHWVCVYMPQKESPCVSEGIWHYRNQACTQLLLPWTQALISIMLVLWPLSTRTKCVVIHKEI